ncbi:hypothetical protein JCM6882_002383 [Rhodosporidiobolus microsporus]
MSTYPPPPSYPTHFQPPAASSTTFLFSPPPRQTRPLNPFLGPRARLSLSWLSQHFLALLLLLVTLSFLLASIPALVRDAKDGIASACQGVEGAASVAVSLPHYMADGVNEMNVAAVAAVTSGAATVIDWTLLAVEKVIIFMIDIYRSLFMCLLDLVVHGSITVLVEGLQTAQDFLEDALGGVRTAIQSTIEGINTGLDSTLGLIDDIPGVDFDIPQIDIPELSALENVTLPDTLVDALRSLNSTIPTYDELKDQLATMISTPIDALRANVNASLANATSSFSVELLPVPAKETVQLCADLDTAWVDDIGRDLGKFVKLMIGLTVLAMALFVSAMALWERYSYRNFLGGVASAREAWLADLLSSSPTGPNKPSVAEETLSTRNLLSFLNASSHPTLFSHLSRLQRLLRLRTPSSKANAIWFLSYIAHPYAWGFLAFGLLGLVVVQVQIAVLDGPVSAMVSKRAEQGAGEFSSSVTGVLEEKMGSLGREWAEKSNERIAALQETINEDLFGWVNETTVSVNTTINAFYDGITDGLTDVFNGTVLESPALNLVYCLLGSKIDSLSTALTWLHSHLHLTLPTVSPSLLTLSQNRTDELTASLTDPDATFSAPSVAQKMLDAYRRGLEQQRVVFCVAVALWGLVVLMGVVGVVWRNRQAKRPLREGEGEAGDGFDDPRQAEDEKRFFPSAPFSFGAAASGVREKMHHLPRLKPLHLRSASSSFPAHPFRRNRSSPPLPDHDHNDDLPAAAATAAAEEPPSPAYALFPRPGETSTASHATVGQGQERDANADLYGNGRSWASLVDFFRPTAVAEGTSATPSPAVAAAQGPPPPSRLRLGLLKSAISRPRPPTGGFAPTSFPAASGVRKRGDALVERARELRGRVEGRREERRRRRRRAEGGEGGWERMSEADGQEGERDLGEAALVHAHATGWEQPLSPRSPVPPPSGLQLRRGSTTGVGVDPFADGEVPAPVGRPTNPFADPLSSPPLPRQKSPSTNPFSSTPSSPPPAFPPRGANPFVDPPLAFGGAASASRPVLPFFSSPGTNPFADSLGGVGTGRAV